MNSTPSRKNAHSGHVNRQSPVAGGVLGALLIHPVAFAVAWLKGFVLGAGVPMAPVPTDRFGFDGGLAGIDELLFAYVSTLGLVPLFISLVGAGFGFVLARRFGIALGASKSSSTRQVASTAPVQLTAVWAAALFIGQFCLQQLLFRSAGTFYPSGLGGILFGLHLCLWIVGATAAFGVHRDLRVAAGLIGVAVLLRLLGPFLPRFLLPAAAIGTLLYFMSQWVSSPSRDKSRVMPTDSRADADALSGFALFALGGVTFYTLVCLYCVFWAWSLPAGSENWGPGMLLILGAWGIPIFGGIAPLLRRWVAAWGWLDSRVVWILVACEICVCGLIWIGVILHG